MSISVGTGSRRPADDILDYAMVTGISIIVIVTAALISSGAPVAATLAIMTITGIISVFTITPHLVAMWLGEDINDILQISPEQ